MLITYLEVMKNINDMKLKDEGYYNSRIEHDIALDKIEAVNETLDEVLLYLKTLSMQNYLIYN